jgi:hypothetical protein
MNRSKQQINVRKIDLINELSKKHMSWSEIKRFLKTKTPNLSEPSVSRILKEMVDAKEIRKYNIGDKKLYMPYNIDVDLPKRIEELISSNIKDIKFLEKLGLFSTGITGDDIIKWLKTNPRTCAMSSSELNNLNTEFDFRKLSDFEIGFGSIAVGSSISSINPKVSINLKIHIDPKVILNSLNQQLETTRISIKLLEHSKKGSLEKAITLDDVADAMSKAKVILKTKEKK